MAADSIGAIRCPLGCGAMARVSVSKKQLSCVTCNGCNSQTFTRSDRSDELVRARIKPVEAPAPVAAPSPLPVPAAPAVAPAAHVAAAPKPARGFGLMKW